MPELPEVETTVRVLKKKVLKRAFIDIWTDFPKLIKKPKSLQEFKKKLKGKKILKIRRRGKNIIFDLSQGMSLLVHQKLTGHLLIGNWKQERGDWKSLSAGPLQEKVNGYIHLIFWLSGNLMLALSDLRKFAKVELWNTRELKESKEFRDLGLEPLEKSFTFEKFKQSLERKRGKIKQVLMDQAVIAGIGNIYSDEILFEAKVHPFEETSKLKEEELKKIYQAIKKILSLAVKLQGESISDYRTPLGKKGFYDRKREVYRREGEKCSRCGTTIKRIKMAGRSAHFCPVCQRRDKNGNSHDRFLSLLSKVEQK